MNKFPDYLFLDDYDRLEDKDDDSCYTNSFQNMETVKILESSHPFFIFLNEFTYGFFDAKNHIIPQYSYNANSFIPDEYFYHAYYHIVKETETIYVKFLVDMNDFQINSILYRAAIEYLREYAKNIRVKIYHRYCGELYECNDNINTDISWYWKTILKFLLDLEELNKEAAKEVFDKLLSLDEE